MQAEHINTNGFMANGGYIDPFSPGGGTLLSDLSMRVEFATGVSANGRSRSPQLYEPRQIFMMLAYTKGAKLTEIGRYIGFSHATVLHALQSFRDKFATARGFRDKVQSIATADEYETISSKITVIA